MRLSKPEVTAIKNAVSALDGEAEVWRFGSRVDDCKRGGDIDLLIYSDRIDSDARRRLRQMIEDALPCRSAACLRRHLSACEHAQADGRPAARMPGFGPRADLLPGMPERDVAPWPR